MTGKLSRPSQRGRDMRALGTAAILLAAAALAPATAGAATHHVHAGQSIQRAIDRARPGDSIVVAAGVYRENLTVTKDRLTLKGAGDSRNGTVLVPPATPHASVCNEFGEVNGICITGRFKHGTQILGRPLVGATVSGFRVRGFTRQGIVFYNARRITVKHSRASGSRHYGIVGFSISDVHVLDDVADGNGQGGIHIGDAPHVRALIAGNHVYGNQPLGGIGIYLRDTTHGVVRANRVDGNCAGIVLVATNHHPMSGWRVERNVVRANSLACGPVENSALPLSGLGIGLLGTQGALVRGNVVDGNRPTKSVPLAGGILLASSSGIGGRDPNGNTVQNNRLSGNAPFDVGYDGSGKRNRFVRNSCRSAVPKSICS
jgi:nitrous oxidase accessory protein NosD